MITAIEFVLSSLACLLQTEGPFENERLWQWHMPPVEVQVAMDPPGDVDPDKRVMLVGLFELEGKKSAPQVLTLDGRIPIVVCGSVPETDLRIVGFDENRIRLRFESSASCCVHDLGMLIESLKVGPSRLKFLGVEKLTPEAKRRRAPEASKALAARGVTLSFPIEGEPFHYRFPGIDSKGHAGQVVILQWWASW